MKKKIIEIRKYLKFKIMKVLLVVTMCMTLNNYLASLYLRFLTYKMRAVIVSITC